MYKASTKIVDDTMPYFVYILQCADKSLYTGITTDIKRRFKEHAQKIGSKYTRARRAEKIVYIERKMNRSYASKREAKIKSWTRAEKIKKLQLKLQ
jgi:putative endonuclease